MSGRIVLDISVSLDGFIAGFNDNKNNPLGSDGMLLHDWVHAEHGRKNTSSPGMLERLKENTGAAIVGRRTYDIVNGWGGTHPFGGIPVLVLSNNSPANVPMGKTEFTFSDDVRAIAESARAKAGNKDVYFIGGAIAAQQFLSAGLVDVIQLHIAPVLLKNGRRLFDDLSGQPRQLLQVEVIEAPYATHVRYNLQ